MSKSIIGQGGVTWLINRQDETGRVTWTVWNVTDDGGEDVIAQGVEGCEVAARKCVVAIISALVAA